MFYVIIYIWASPKRKVTYMITNDRMQIRKVNIFLSLCIKKIKEKIIEDSDITYMRVFYLVDWFQIKFQLTEDDHAHAHTYTRKYIYIYMHCWHTHMYIQIYIVDILLKLTDKNQVFCFLSRFSCWRTRRHNCRQFKNTQKSLFVLSEYKDCFTVFDRG